MKKRSIAGRLGIAALALTLITTSLSSGTLAKYSEEFGATGILEIAHWNVAASFIDVETGERIGEEDFKATGATEPVSLSDLAKNAYILPQSNLDGHDSTITAYGSDALRLTGATAQHYIKGATDSDPGTGENFARIAPGTEGYIGIRVTMNIDEKTNPAQKTEVATKFEVRVQPNKDTNAPKYLKFNTGTPVYKDGTSSGVSNIRTFKDFTTLTPMNTNAATKIGEATFYPDEDKISEIIWIHWVWPYDDGIDTAAGGTHDEYDNEAGHNAAGGDDLELVFTVDATQVAPKIATA